MLRLVALFVVLALHPGCALSHDARRSICGAAPLEEPSLDAAQREGLIRRLRHEVTHVAEGVSLIAEGARPPTDRWTVTEDGGSMDVRGELVFQDGETTLVAEFTFVHFTGRHGGWGLSALEGRACATIVVARDGARTIDVSAAVGLVEDGPLQGAPTASVWYVEHADEIAGAVGGVPIPSP